MAGEYSGGQGLISDLTKCITNCYKVWNYSCMSGKIPIVAPLWRRREENHSFKKNQVSCVRCHMSGVMCYVCNAPVTCHMFITSTATNPPPAFSPSMHSKMLLMILTSIPQQWAAKIKTYFFFITLSFDNFFAKIVNLETQILLVLFIIKYFCNWSIWFRIFVYATNRAFFKIALFAIFGYSFEPIMLIWCHLTFKSTKKNTNRIYFLTKDWNSKRLGVNND